MTRLWLTLLFLAVAGFAAVWAADHPGSVVIHWLNYQIETSAAFLVLLAIIAAWLFVYLYAAVTSVTNIPRQYAMRQQLKHYDQGLKELTYSVAALASSDLNSAEKHAFKARKMLGQTPMGLLISAQISKSRGDEERTRALLDEMLGHKETKQIANRLLTGETEPTRSKVYVWGQKLRSFIQK